MIDVRQGDCLELLPTVKDNSVELILTDLPYGTTYCTWDTVIPFEPLWEQFDRVLTEKGIVVLTANQPFTTDVINSNRDDFKYELIWTKPIGVNFLNAKKRPMTAHENVLIFYKKFGTYNPQKTSGKAYNTKESKTNSASGIFNSRPENATANKNTGERYPLTYFTYPSVKGTGHHTAKPLDMIEMLVRTYSNEGETVLDATMGSGTTGAACVLSGRDFIGFELDKEIFTMAEQRIMETVKREFKVNSLLDF